MAKNLTPAALLAIVNKDVRTAADITNGSAYLRRSTYLQALWADVRIGTDGASATDVAEEAGVVTSRISQVRYGVRAMANAGIPMPTTVAEADTAEAAYMHISRVYKSGKAARARLKDTVKRAETIADVDGKYAALCAVIPDTADDNKRGGRPEGNTTAADDTADENNNGAPTTGATVTERESTLVERMRSILADVKGGPIADIESVLTLANEISDAIVARAEGALVVAE